MNGKGAFLDAKGLYRFKLWRDTHVLQGEGIVTFVLLNPSIADAMADDPTVRRCLDFASRWGKERMQIVNLFAWRATQPHDLHYQRAQGRDIVGEDNDRYIKSAARESVIVVAGWGRLRHLWAKQRAEKVLAMLRERTTVMTLGLTKCGRFPKHPLYIRRETELRFW